uniref:Retrotransposon gag domain-containing protein n=1 Tax=Lactuca sativa TaxID=4236 RepID=A0A9R1UDD6_LACSA|nr:hypothetical protein LSAT_V11C900464370 [Lactuca sativa]
MYITRQLNWFWALVFELLFRLQTSTNRRWMGKRRLDQGTSHKTWIKIKDTMAPDVESALALLANDINKIMRCIGPMVNKLEDLDKRVELMETGLKEYQEERVDLHPTREKPPPFNPDIRFPTFPEKFDCDVFRKWVKEVELYFEYYHVPGYQQFELVVASLPQEGEVFQWWQDIKELCTRTRLPLLIPIGWNEMKRLVMHKFLRPMLNKTSTVSL